MTVYKYFLRVAAKYKVAILIYTMIFFMLSIINGVSTERKEVKFEDTKLNIGIIDNMNSELSKGLIDYLGEKNNIVDTIEDEAYIKEQIFLEVVDGVIIIPEDFDEKVGNKEESIKIYKDDRKIGASYLSQQIEKFLVFVNASNEGGELELDSVKMALNEKANVKILDDNTKKGNIAAKIWFKYYYNFTSYIIVAIYITVIGLIMMEFKDEKIENRMKISSKKFIKYNGEIYLGQITLGILITSIFILGSIVLKGKHIGEVDFSKYLINVFVFSFSILCFTFLINNLVRNKFVVSGVSTVASLGTSMISGVMVPQEFLGEKVLTIAKFFPTYYYVRINEMDVNSFLDMRYEIFMQVLFGIAFLLMGLYFSKIKRKAH